MAADGEGTFSSTVKDNHSKLQKRYVDATRSLYREGILGENYTRFQEQSPEAVIDTVTLFLEDCPLHIRNLNTALKQQRNIDFKRVDAIAKRVMHCSNVIGAMRVKQVCLHLRTYSQARNSKECLKCLQKFVEEICVLKDRLDDIFSLALQLRKLGENIPVVVNIAE